MEERWKKSIEGTEPHFDSLDVIEDSAERDRVKEAILNRFPSNFISRREFLGWMGALGAVLSTGCTRQPVEKILPYTEQPEGLVPGKPLHFASSFVNGGDVQGILVESHMGRPTKIEGNPSHPSSLGATDRFAQASVLDLYDPDRCKELTYRGVATAWSNLAETLEVVLTRQAELGGAGIRILSETLYSPSLMDLLEQVQQKFPKSKWFVHDALDRREVGRGARLAFGRDVATHYQVEEADVLVSFDCDFLDTEPGHVGHAKAFAKRRRLDSKKIPRLYAFESTPTVSGMAADHRWAVSPDRIYAFALEMAKQLGLSVPASELSEGEKKVVSEIVADLNASRATALVMVGAHQSAELHALAHQINRRLGSVGRTVTYTETPRARRLANENLDELIRDMRERKVELLLVLGGNPVLTMPSDSGFSDALKRVTLSMNLSTSVNETSEHCQWQIPQAHFLESWDDVQAPDGTSGIGQPMIKPLYNGKSRQQVVSYLLGDRSASDYDLVKNYWKKRTSAGFERKWKRAVHDGVFKDSAYRTQRPGFSAKRFSAPKKSSGLQVVFRADPNVGAGEFANNPWLQELPKPVTKITWDNVVHVSDKTAKELGLKNGNVVELKVGDAVVNGPIWVTPGQAEGVLTVPLGYGRKKVGRIGKGHGFNGYVIRKQNARWVADNVEVKKTGKSIRIASTQEHFKMDGRDLVRSSDYETIAANPTALKKPVHEDHGTENEGGFPFEDPNYAWGMVIDLNACTGCNACLVACQSENNISTVGKDEVLMGREMHWLRIDQYIEQEGNAAQFHHQPVPCMHCEKAPCEVVCPVNATTHSPSGLNEMTYNRCVGTKYCGNNCPYKVRRFNFYQYADVKTPSIQLGRNPDVTVRSRGVMEKCTYCVQRINQARIDAKKDGRTVRDGEIKTACETVCPSEAIVFGNLKDKGSRVSKLRESPLNYGLLEELGTKPRTTYLAKLRNPNPKLEGMKES